MLLHLYVDDTQLYIAISQKNFHPNNDIEIVNECTKAVQNWFGASTKRFIPYKP